MASDPSNLEIAAVFDELADLYELDGAIVHRVMAYRSAAKAAREAMVSVSGMTRQGRVTELSGIGKTLEEKLVALLETGEIPSLEKLRAKYPPGLLALTRLPGLGPKRARRLFDELGIDSPEMLRAAIEAQKLRGLKGFGPKFEASMLSSLEAGIADAPAQRVLLHRALTVGEQIVAALRAHPAAERVELAGSARRQADSVKDLDIIATATDPGALARALGELDLIESASAPNEHAARGRTHTGLPVDLRVVEPENFGNLLQHFTGSQAHNVALREAAVRRGLHVSEYGILDDETGETLRCATEEEVYERLGLTFPEPELRENRGELAADFAPPRLVTVDDLRGDLHMHTTASDGRNSIEEMARAGLARGYEYIAITDHSATHGFGNHVTPDELERQIERIAEVNERIDGITVLAGTETNILPDGSPDYDDELLARLDWVVGSIHTAFGTPAREMTRRMIAAMEHPHIDVIGHPTGRKIGRRQGYGLDIDDVIAAAARTGTMLEINSAPDRRDLDDVHARAAARAGVLITIDSDAHGANTMHHVRWGIATARRAWLTPEHVANTRPWAQFAKLRKRVRATG
ncbi:MAG TPA: DNA polymerase/3'-5' exonuclease PolX [Solirubrobacteraceae bacterium]|nr:DNA polymerase/3'-5' exonuclease PolX [Solirubrobacteraceae bacterium]